MTDSPERLSDFLFELERLLQYELDTDPANFAHDRNEGLQIYIDRIEQVVTNITGSEDESVNPCMARLLGMKSDDE